MGLITLNLYVCLSSLLDGEVLRVWMHGARYKWSIQWMFIALNHDLQEDSSGPDVPTTQEQEITPKEAPHSRLHGCSVWRQTSFPPPPAHGPFPYSARGSCVHRRGSTCLYNSVWPDNCPETFGLFVTDINSWTHPRTIESGFQERGQEPASLTPQVTFKQPAWPQVCHAVTKIPG